MKNRISTKPGRRLIIPEAGGAPYYAKIEHADEPLEEGTRLDKAALLADDTAAFLGLDPATATPNEAFKSAVPKGVIVMWSGAIADIPKGWALCNGLNGTPNLRNRFIVGAGGTYSVGVAGGADSVKLSTAQLPAHKHSGKTDADGAHQHQASSASSSSGSTAGIATGLQSSAFNIPNTNSAHAHAFTTDSTGSDEAHENRPPYYALAYIMKI